MEENIRWIVKTDQTMNMCDKIYFRRMHESLSPGKTQMLTSHTVLRELLKIKNQVSESMKVYLVGQYCALTTDYPRQVGVFQDVSSRWWSTYTMTERLIHFKNYFDLMETEGLLRCNLSESQWVTTKLVRDVLRPFVLA